ncbi:hypothetical protein [Fibrobacter succinogenes]|uniref:HNH nuclease domain-containing protein n=1 Tax=Fibrobacter succinogenes TaxID=833 RepID=A0A380S5W6_FIBSU|nr:hypothetical protein [Fibrobacter succinogenes]PWJ35967.1 hypothetical protein IE02_2030 [Fibrobacter succinogenes subsp. elongatus]SUQ24622.1 hypothetical protein SAMN05661053_2030 [Fibrobacter succinogenes]
MIRINKKKDLESRHWEWYEYYLENKNIPLECNLPNGKKNVLSFIEHVLGWDKSILKEIVLAKPEMLHFLAERNNIFWEQYKNASEELVKIKKKGWPEAREWRVNQVLKEYFGYSDFEKGRIQNDDVDKDDDENKIKWSAYEFTRRMNLDVCPYCGRQYIFTISDGDGRPQIDHYYPQADYPFLSCSIYNFIPSCPQCNLQKGEVLNKYATKEEQSKHKEYIYDSDDRAFVLYPYEDAFECRDADGNMEKRAWFSALYGNINDDEPMEDFVCVKIKMKDSLSQEMERKISNSIKAFHLNELYSCQQIEIKDLLSRYRHYCKPRIDEITKLILRAQLDEGYNGNYNSIIIRTYTRRIKNEVLGLPVNVGDKQYPLRKFKEDIIAQLDATYKKMKK